MNKNERHVKAEEFRAQIVRPAQRAEAVRSLTVKDIYDEADKLRIGILLHKVSNAIGCEDAYRGLIVRLYQDEELRPKAAEFYKRWMAK